MNGNYEDSHTNGDFMFTSESVGEGHPGKYRASSCVQCDAACWTTHRSLETMMFWCSLFPVLYSCFGFCYVSLINDFVECAEC